MSGPIFVYLLLLGFCQSPHGEAAIVTDQELALHTESPSPAIVKEWTGNSLISHNLSEDDDHTCAAGRPCKNGACCGARYAQTI
jgi:hypothetical protein